MTPADVAENLMPKVVNEDVETSFERLIQALRSSKEETVMKAKKEEGISSNGEDSSEEETEEALVHIELYNISSHENIHKIFKLVMLNVQIKGQNAMPYFWVSVQTIPFML